MKQKDGTLRYAALTASSTLAADGPLCRVWFFPFGTLAFYISWLQLFDKILRAILSVVKSDGSIRGRGLKALALIVDSDPSLLADVCLCLCSHVALCRHDFLQPRVKECVGAYITDPQVSVREAAVELLSRLVRQDATMIEHYLPTIFERTRVRLEQFCRLMFSHRCLGCFCTRSA